MRTKPLKSPTPGKDIQDDSGVFTNFMRRLINVPHSEIKAKLDAEREAKRTSKAASRVSAEASR